MRCTSTRRSAAQARPSTRVRKSGRKALVGFRPMTRVGRAVEKGETQGFMKVVVDAETGMILGAAILGVGGDEVIHSILDVMSAGAPYTTVDAHRAHPPDRQRAGADDAGGAETAGLADRPMLSCRVTVATRKPRWRNVCTSDGCTWSALASTIGLCCRAEPETEAVEVVLTAGRTVPARAETRLDPMHMVLGGEHRQRHQGVEFVAALGAGVRESCSDLVAPCPVHAPTSGLLGERLKSRRDVAHVRRAAQHDAVCGVEDVQSVSAIRSTAMTVTSPPASRAPRCDGVGQHRSVPEARVIGDRHRSSSDARAIVVHVNSTPTVID